MKTVALNFSNHLARKQRKRDVVVMLISLVLIVFMGREATLLEKQKQNDAVAQNRQHVLQRPTVVIDIEQQKLAQTMADRLNVPWYDLLAALESVLQAHPEVYLKSVLPDAKKDEVIISGEVKRLELLLPYIDSLNQHALFSHALPITQQHEPVSDVMTFTLKVEWRQ